MKKNVAKLRMNKNDYWKRKSHPVKLNIRQDRSNMCVIFVISYFTLPLFKYSNIDERVRVDLFVNILLSRTFSRPRKLICKIIKIETQKASRWVKWIRTWSPFLGLLPRNNAKVVVVESLLNWPIQLSLLLRNAWFFDSFRANSNELHR